MRPKIAKYWFILGLYLYFFFIFSMFFSEFSEASPHIRELMYFITTTILFVSTIWFFSTRSEIRLANLVDKQIGVEKVGLNSIGVYKGIKLTEKIIKTIEHSRQLFFYQPIPKPLKESNFLASRPWFTLILDSVPRYLMIRGIISIPFQPQPLSEDFTEQLTQLKKKFSRYEVKFELRVTERFSATAFIITDDDVLVIINELPSETEESNFFSLQLNKQGPVGKAYLDFFESLWEGAKDFEISMGND